MQADTSKGFWQVPRKYQPIESVLLYIKFQNTITL